MLAGCVSVLNREGCVLVGGHTSEGSEPALGLSSEQYFEYLVRNTFLNSSWFSFSKWPRGTI
jgi:hypothetical protein